MVKLNPHASIRGTYYKPKDWQQAIWGKNVRLRFYALNRDHKLRVSTQVILPLYNVAVKCAFIVSMDK